MHKLISNLLVRPSLKSSLNRSLSFNAIDVSAEVSEALISSSPLVALESTIITHGMPYPHNLQTAARIEEIVREQGAVPATIAILGGRIKVGLDRSQLTELAEMKTPAVKTSRRDLPYVLSNRLNGGTTVSGTIVVADLVGIQVFVTGGIGGVHRGGERTLDVSADLNELGRNSVAVVSSGVKSILDIGKTLEYLETQGVCVATYGPSKEFPSFYTRRSGHHAPYNVTSPEQAARLIRALHEVRLKSGFLLAVPIPEEDAVGGADGGAEMERAISDALQAAAARGVTGKEVTPYLLAHVNRLTEGKSLAANKALIEHNASVGARVAVELSRLQNERAPRKPNVRRRAADSTTSPVVIGGCVLDCVISVDEDSIQLDGRTHRGTMRQSGGGVGRNIADALGKLGETPYLVSAVGRDQYGAYLLRRTLGHVDCGGVEKLQAARTACYNVMTDQTGDCKLGIGDMAIHSEITSTLILKHADRIRSAPLVILDGNVPLDTLDTVLTLCQQAGVPVWFEPTDVRKAAAPYLTDAWKCLKFISPNLNELKVMANALDDSVDVESSDKKSLSNVLDEAFRLCQRLVEHGTTAVITLGGRGVLIVREGTAEEAFYEKGVFTSGLGGSVQGRYYPTMEITDLTNVSGAGDCFASGFIRSMLLGEEESRCVSTGFAASQLALHSASAVPKEMHLRKSDKAQYTTIFH